MLNFRRSMSNFRFEFLNKYSEHPSVLIGSMDSLCLHCHALKFKNESIGMCCSNGKVKLPPLNEPLEPLRSYVSGIDNLSKHFLELIRQYNSVFQMTSFGASKIPHDNGFMPTFKVQGQVYHKIGSLLPLPETNSKFLQIYFMGNKSSEIDQRCTISKGTKREIISNLQQLLHKHNYLVKLFKTSLERMPTDEYQILIRADKTPPGEHERRFNAPTIDETAIIIVGTEFDKRDIIIQKRDSNLQRVTETHRSYDALQYPLLFWQGEDGYHFKNMQINPSTGLYTEKKVGCYCFVRVLRNNFSKICKFYRYLAKIFTHIASWLELINQIIF